MDIVAPQDDASGDQKSPHAFFDNNFYTKLHNTMFFYSIVLYAIQGVIQLSVSIYFSWSTRHLKNVSLWLKVMSWMPNLSWICYIPMWQ